MNGNSQVWKWIATTLSGIVVGLVVAIYAMQQARQDFLRFVEKNYITNEDFERRLQRESPYAQDRSMLSGLQAKVERNADEIREMRTKLDWLYAREKGQAQ